MYLSGLKQLKLVSLYWTSEYVWFGCQELSFCPFQIWQYFQQNHIHLGPNSSHTLYIYINKVLDDLKKLKLIFDRLDVLLGNFWDSSLLGLCIFFTIDSIDIKIRNTFVRLDC
jgi:hypothetical protein